ncbi:peptide chain release factor N(5)-glutamine methyltransferase [Peptostreptococcus russellii]|uniref:peptide chain release factor N(5)-glutamine methyltransferase n=1 Tax=Peptostreptococcus russellii TaxID=215200 RepID=UPI0016246D35|nr:peptide chain release factor N(5)-glutamine methyltransferase [Peptostreptococcus russellii]MBC2577961.1 peptide chain release factor N(5)-glutamine methyltransferase [Peptostreptococcus russellii]
MKKIREIIAEYTEKLTPYSQSARLDVEILLSYVLNIEDKIKLMLNYDKAVDEKSFKEFESLFNKRLNKMPIAYIINKKEFMGIEFYVDENVLIPRPDTEVIVEELISKMNSLSDKKNIKILDMCVGSGAIILSSAILAENANSFQLFGVDISKGALKVCKKNAENLNVKNIQLIESNLFESTQLETLKGQVDIIVSNPPYIEEKVIASLDSDVKDYEPFIALSGGESGMDFYNKIIEDSREFLKDGGMLIFESGHDQADKIADKMSSSGFENIYTKKDIQGFERMIAASFKK